LSDGRPEEAFRRGLEKYTRSAASRVRRLPVEQPDAATVESTEPYVASPAK